MTDGRAKPCSSMGFSFSSRVNGKKRSIACRDHGEEGSRERQAQSERRRLQWWTLTMIRYLP
jgi:hypothetical protein